MIVVPVISGTRHPSELTTEDVITSSRPRVRANAMVWKGVQVAGDDHDRIINIFQMIV